ncbi:MAG TPA: DUF882 domain-containing protein [Polyangiaceae bacterium]|jgi:hypothetical protein|nr:DUF882 domain-containing protein [Polyangiaceae bacterium]
MRARFLGLCLAALLQTAPAGSAILKKPQRLDFSALVPAPRPSETTWVTAGLSRSRRFELSSELALPWLERYLRPSQNYVPDWKRFWRGRYGASAWSFAPTLSWSAADVPEPETLSIVPSRPCPRWQAPKPVTVMHFTGASERFPLLDCEGGVASEAIDGLGLLAGLPEELPIDPRLVWVVQQIAQAFPGHALVLVSGYRDGHSGLHQQGRALDLYVRGVPNSELFAVCKELRDVGCGYYPENTFVHVDVRPYATGHVLWVDVSRPGEPSVYVDGWPGVVEPGQVWLGN